MNTVSPKPWLVPVIIALALSLFISAVVLTTYFKVQKMAPIAVTIAPDNLLKYGYDSRGLHSDTKQSLNNALDSLVKAKAKAVTATPTEQDRQAIVSLLQLSIAEARKAVTGQQDHPTPWLVLGDIYAYLVGTTTGSEDFALQTYNQALKLDKDNFIYYERIGDVYQRLNKSAEARQAYNAALDLKPYEEAKQRIAAKLNTIK